LDAVTKQVINDKLKNLSADDNKSQSMDESILMEKGELAAVDKVGENGSGDNQLDANEKQTDEQPQQQQHHRENGGGGGVSGVDKEVRHLIGYDVI
jgi:hypothetical protein